MGGWQEVTLGDLLHVKHGFAFLGEYFAEAGTHIVLTPGNFKERGGFRSKGDKEKWYTGPIPREYVLRRGDVLIAMTEQAEGLLGASAIVPTDDRYLHNQRLGLVKIRDLSRIDLGFVYHLFNLPDVRQQIRASASGTKVRHTSPSRIAAVRVQVPPLLEEQRRIAGVLFAYDDLIENCERRIRVLDEMARALYREWLPSDGCDSESLTAQQLIDGGVLEINDGYRAKNSELGIPGLPFARAGNVKGGFNFEGADSLLEANVAKVGSKVSTPGDIVFTSKGTVGRFAKVRTGTPRFVYSPQLCFWRVLRGDVISPNYLFRWMQSREFLDQVDSVKGSTDMADYVSLTNQRRMLVRVPDAAVQRRADVVLGPIEDLIGILADRRELLRKTRDMLLPRLLSGQLSLEDAAA